MTARVEPVDVRIGTPADLPVLRCLFRRSSLANEGDRAALLASPEWLELSGSGLAEGRTRVAVRADGTIIGFITSVSRGGWGLEVEDLFVDPDWMRRGVGRQLINDVVAAAGRAGVTRIEVTANPHAGEFYRSVGFVAMHDVDTELGPAARMALTPARDCDGRAV